MPLRCYKVLLCRLPCWVCWFPETGLPCDPLALWTLMAFCTRPFFLAADKICVDALPVASMLRVDTSLRPTTPNQQSPCCHKEGKGHWLVPSNEF